MRRPKTNAAASAAAPAFTWIAVPPAKSSPFRSAKIHPSESNTQCATGAYTSSDHAAMKIRNGPNFARSANAPVISAGVMMANISWNAMNNSCGMVVTCPSGAAPTPFNPK